MGGLSRKDLSEQIFESLRQRITTLEISPGARINVNALSEEFAVSTIPIREALKRLTERQLIVVTPSVGYHATSLSTKDIMDAFAFRKILETNLLPKAMEMVSHKRLQELRDASILLIDSNMPEEEKRQAFDETDNCLHHEFILNSSENRFIRMTAGIVYYFLLIARRLRWQLDQSLQEHVGIIDAWMKGDTIETNRRLSLHLDRSMEKCLTPAVLVQGNGNLREGLVYDLSTHGETPLAQTATA